MAVGRIAEYRLGTNTSWDEYVERLEMFCEANKIAKEEQKRAVLLSCCGEEAYGLIVTLVKPSRPTAATYEEIKTAVRKHLHPRPSELYARFLFYKTNQAADESVADYITALRKLAEDCGFGDEQLPLDIMMRDRFVSGLQNEAVQQRLVAKHDLTFNVAYDMAATAEATAKQQRDIRMQGRDEAKDCQGMMQATRTKQDATAEGSSCYRCNGPRWKVARVVAIRGPVSYIVQLDNGERHHRHRNQLRRAWTRLGSRSSLKCRLPRQAASYSQTTTTAAGQHGSSRRGKSGPSYPRPGRAANINMR
ncbi:uncharacterized protein [Dermacentor andersoni]|uniref:uncharacterized protein n=1 Tax=Dermacentor andersoni TaxID=34620 RepID=UPI003B3BE06A